jgi:hypothetical protein
MVRRPLLAARHHAARPGGGLEFEVGQVERGWVARIAGLLCARIHRARTSAELLAFSKAFAPETSATAAIKMAMIFTSILLL